ncbi:Peroxygenase 1 [Maublancomyces gigas]|uniref:Peroxygenase 1 n=1 Tax=Discina gigas TaxID=1032678 RepID=A0ABR3GMY2_9PEZI
MTSKPIIRHAIASDVPLILEFITELAVYENEPDAVLATEELLLDTLGFNENSKCYAKTLLIFDGEKPAGMALYFNNYSTWRARPGIYLEDLFVRPEFRGRGFGTALLAALAQELIDTKGGRLEWSVLKWNTPSIKFYESIGAENMGKEWQVMRLADDTLTAMATRGPEVERR